MAVHPFQSEGQPVLIFQPIVAKLLPPVKQKFEWKEKGNCKWESAADVMAGPPLPNHEDSPDPAGNYDWSWQKFPQY